MERIITIIIAAYNEEENIGKCLDSVLGQTNNLFKVIVVNDGSSDNTLNILNRYNEKFKEKDIVYSIITKDNGGLSSARNCGIQNVDTKYFSVLDADDTITDDYIEKITSGIAKNNYPDVYKICLTKMDEEGKELTKSKKLKTKKVSGEKAFCDMAFYDPLFVPAQLYVIKTSYFNENNFAFTEGIYHEDFDLIPNVLVFAKTFSTNNDYVYNYYEVQGSITNTTDPKKVIKKANDVWDIYKKNIRNGKVYLEKEKISYNTYIHFVQYYAVGILEKAKELVSKKDILHEDEKIAKEYEKFMDKVYNGCIYTNILLEGMKNSIKRFILKYFMKYYLRDFDKDKK